MGDRPKVKIIGGSWLGHSKSFSLREDNKDIEPTYFSWESGNNWNGKTVFFADGGARESFPLAFMKKIAILIEPRSLHPENYEYVEQHHDRFHHVLTYDRELLNAIPNGLFYPLGGSSIAFEDWGIYPKTKDVCMIVSKKNSMPGHKLRHEIVEQFQGRIDFYGAGVGKPFERKFDVLKDYKYCVVVESERKPTYFTEKLIDAFSVGCFPIYCGGISMFAEYSFFDLDWLDMIIESKNDVELNLNALSQVQDDVKQYRISEDWIYLHYPELFK